jgi:hypothetical protein
VTKSWRDGVWIMECLLAAIWWDKGAIVAAHPPYPPQTKASNPGWHGKIASFPHDGRAVGIPTSFRRFASCLRCS